MGIDSDFWEVKNELAVDLLNAIEMLSSTNMKRIDHDAFVVYWVGNKILRVDIRMEALQ